MSKLDQVGRNDENNFILSHCALLNLLCGPLLPHSCMKYQAGPVTSGVIFS